MSMYCLFLKKNNNNIKVVAIALDDNTKVWQQAISNYPGWIHLQAKNMWDDELVKLFAVYATPTVYVLDEGFMIVGKPKTVYELKL